MDKTPMGSRKKIGIRLDEKTLLYVEEQGKLNGISKYDAIRLVLGNFAREEGGIGTHASKTA